MAGQVAVPVPEGKSIDCLLDTNWVCVLLIKTAAATFVVMIQGSSRLYASPDTPP